MCVWGYLGDLAGAGLVVRPRSDYRVFRVHGMPGKKQALRGKANNSKLSFRRSPAQRPLMGAS